MVPVISATFRLIFQLEYAACRHLGNAEAAMHYQIERMVGGQQASGAALIALRDTHIRVRGRHRKYDSKTLTKFTEALGAFLSRPSAQVTVIGGQIVDDGYIGAMEQAEALAGRAITCRRLNPAGPLMNFVLLDYANGEHEVLFGFGRLRQDDGSEDESVFVSDDKNMVAEFSTLYRSLVDNSDHAELPELHASQSMTVRSTWNQKRFHDFIERVPRRSVVRLLGTFFIIDVSELHTMVKKLLAKDVTLQIVLLNPDNRALLEARFGTRTDHWTSERAQEKILEQIAQLPKIPAQMDRRYTGTLEVRLSDTMPCGYVVHAQHGVLVGLMPAHASYLGAPMIDADADTDVWSMFEKDWAARWAAARPI